MTLFGWYSAHPDNKNSLQGINLNLKDRDQLGVLFWKSELYIIQNVFIVFDPYCENSPLTECQSSCIIFQLFFFIQKSYVKKDHVNYTLLSMYMVSDPDVWSDYNNKSSLIEIKSQRDRFFQPTIPKSAFCVVVHAEIQGLVSRYRPIKGQLAFLFIVIYDGERQVT